ncbi:MAG: glycerophosphoryl diester phosphodiesterase, partial [Limisphaerales bacterium]
YDFSFNLNDEIIIVGHAGMGIASLYPSNSVESVRRAIALGAGGIELDVQMTADGEVVVYHDQFLETETNSEGAIWSLPLSDVLEAEYKQPIYARYKVVSLENMFFAISESEDLWLSLDMKIRKPDADQQLIEDFADAIYSEIESANLLDKVIVESRSFDLLKYFQTNYPLVKRVINGLPENAIQEALTLEAYGVGTELENMSLSIREELAELGLRIILFDVVSKKENREAYRYNAEFIQTDKLGYLLGI